MAEVYGYNDNYEEYNNERLNLSEDDSASSFDSSKTTPQYHVQKAEMALSDLKFVVKEPGWKKILQHKGGTTIYSKPGITKEDQLPVYMGEHIIEGFTSRAIFAVVGMRKLWDEWYEEGSLIENLNDTTSLTYMVMQALAGSKSRDLSLVEKIECTQSGTIYFIATSVETPKVPRVSNKIRAHLNLNGWILEPLSYNPPRTRVLYVLQTKIKGWVPAIVSKNVLSRRPLVLYTIDQYLQKNGALPMVLSTTPPESARPSRSQSASSSTHHENNNINNMLNIEVKYPRKKISFTNIHDVTPDSPIQTTEEIQNGFLLHQDEPISSSLSSPTQTTSPIRPLSPTIPTEKPTICRPKSSAISIRHRHTVFVERALELFRSHIPLYGWNLHSEDKGIKIYMKGLGKPTLIMRGDGVISGGFTTYDILSVIKNLKLWDDGFEDGATFEMFSLHEHLTRVSMKGIFPISGRDFSVCGTLNHDEDTGILQFITTSVVDPLIPESKKYVRGDLNISGWQLTPHFDANGNTTSVDVVYIADIDIKLDMIPSSIRKTLSVQIPTNVAKVNEYMKRNGFPPYVVNSKAKIVKEFSGKNDQYELSLIAVEGGVVEIKLSKLMYPNGVEVTTIPENCKVELLSNSRDAIRITFPQKIDLDTSSITINKRSKGFQMTYNYGLTIPTISNIRNPVEVATVGNPVEITKKSISTKPKRLRNSTNVTTSSEATINSESDNVTGSDKTNKNDKRNPRKHKKSALISRNMITSKTFINPAEAPLKLEPHQRLLEKQILLENKIAAVTRASRALEMKPSIEEFNDYSTPLEVEPKIEEFQASNGHSTSLEVKSKTEEPQTSNDNLVPLEIKSKTEEPQASSENLVPSEVKPKIDEPQASNDNLVPLEIKPKAEALNDNLVPLEVKTNTDEPQESNDYLVSLEVKSKIDESHNDLSLKNNSTNEAIKNNAITLSKFSKLTVVTGSVQFNSQQIGLIFASMLLAYYAGKLDVI